jgi:hypothetical protein
MARVVIPAIGEALAGPRNIIRSPTSERKIEWMRTRGGKLTAGSRFMMATWELGRCFVKKSSMVNCWESFLKLFGVVASWGPKLRHQKCHQDFLLTAAVTATSLVRRAGKKVIGAVVNKIAVMAENADTQG